MFGGKAKIPLVVRTVHGAGAGAAAQHSQSLYNMFAAIPKMRYMFRWLLKLRISTR